MNESYSVQPPAKKSRKGKIIGGAVAVLALGGIIGAMTGGGDDKPLAPIGSGVAPQGGGDAGQPAAPLPPTSGAPAAPAGPATTFRDGVYEVGVDIEAGRYRTDGPDPSSYFPSCYYARLANDSGNFDAIKANNNIQGPGSVTLSAGEFVEASGGCTWTK